MRFLLVPLMLLSVGVAFSAELTFTAKQAIKKRKRIVKQIEKDREEKIERVRQEAEARAEAERKKLIEILEQERARAGRVQNWTQVTALTAEIKRIKEGPLFPKEGKLGENDEGPPKAVRAPKPAINKPSPNEAVASVSIVRGAEKRELINGMTAYSNRSYVWRNVPAGLPVKNFARINLGHPNDTVEYRVSKPGYVYLVADAGEDIEGWEKTPLTVNFTSHHFRLMSVWRKPHRIGVYRLHQNHFQGPVLLLP